MFGFRGLLLAGVLAALPAAATARKVPPALEVRVVVVTAFEIGEDTGDVAGEFQRWAEVTPQILPFPAGYRHLRYDPARKVLLLSTGVGTNRAAVSTVALGHDPRFDLTHAYWLVSAIAGVNPETASVGSAAWIGDVVDTDYGYAIDPREAPKGWTSGMFARDSKAPYEGKRGDTRYNLFPLDHGLRDWAHGLTRSVPLPDTPALRQIRTGYAQWPAATRPPSVIVGTEASGQTFWHGALLNTHVSRWVDYWTGTHGSFVMTAMEDTGVANALAALGREGRVDPARLLVLRTGSNYSVQPAGQGAAQSLIAETNGLSALQPSLDAAFRVGSVVVDELSRNWPRHREAIPRGAPESPSS